MTQIVISISEVMETMFYIPVEPRDGETTIGQSNLIGESATITFKGTFSGSIDLIVPRNLLMIMTENFMGEEREHLTSEHLEGTLKESLNMLAGNTFSKIDKESSFCLGVPEINTSSITNLSKKALSEYLNTPIIVIDTMDGPIGINVQIHTPK